MEGTIIDLLHIPLFALTDHLKSDVINFQFIPCLPNSFLIE